MKIEKQPNTFSSNIRPTVDTPLDRACRELHAEYVRTRDLAGIAAANHVSQAWLKKRWRALGLNASHKGAFRQARAAAIVAAYQQGESATEIAARFHICRRSVYHVLRRHGMTKPRNKSPHPRGSETFRRGQLAAAA
jgi:hypothetical protein